MKTIIFVDFWSGFNPIENYFTRLLDHFQQPYKTIRYEECSEDKIPDIVFYSIFHKIHQENLFKNCKKVFFTGENRCLDKTADLNLTFDHSTSYNNIRLPLWLLYLNTAWGGKKWSYPKDITLTPDDKGREFCAFVYSNDRAKFRNKFCKKLSKKYRKVTCGGDCLNNIGQKVKNKILFQRGFKFCIAFENNLRPGYTTEKILDAFRSNCIPIYYGSDRVHEDFNPETFINGHDFENYDRLIEYVQKVDTKANLYQKFLNKSVFSDYWREILNDPEETFFRNVALEIMKDPKKEKFI